MIVIPAIDLLKNRVVRLKKGKKESAVVYDDDPLNTARRWADCGAELIHIVDLDAAFGDGDNINVVDRIVSSGIDVEFGGGVRSVSKAESLINMGVKRLVIGTKAADRSFLTKIINEFGSRIAVGVDVLDGKFMKLGWQRDSGYEAKDFITYLINNGVQWVIYTDISRDGMLEGVNIEALKWLKGFKNVNFIISGGISSLDDIKKIKAEIPFVQGVIIGKALYEGRIDLRKAISI